MPRTAYIKQADNIAQAAQVYKTRRGARRSIVNFTEFTKPMFHASWYHHTIGTYLERLDRRAMTENLMIFAPPQHGKSEMVSLRRPAWSLGNDPDKHFMLICYGDSLAKTWGKGVRDILEGSYCQQLWQTKFNSESETRWSIVRENDDLRPSLIAAGIQSPLTGQGATDMVIDDPFKNESEAYSEVIRESVWNNYVTSCITRLRPDGRQCLIMTRWHEDDLAGRLLDQARKNKTAPQWVVLCFSATNDSGQDAYVENTRTGKIEYFPPYDALWPEFKNREYLETQRAVVGEVFWQAMFMQRPTSPTGGIFKRDNWAWFEGGQPLTRLVQVYDTAQEEKRENDYSASITMGATADAKFPILDAWRDKITFPHLVAKVYDRWAQSAKLYGRFPDHVLVENKSSGAQLIQQIETNNLIGLWTFPDGQTKKVPFIPVVRMPAEAAKDVLALGISGYQEGKQIMLPSGAEWVADFVNEHAVFPKGKNDDWVSCTTHGMRWYTRPTKDEEHEEIHGMMTDFQIDSELNQMFEGGFSMGML